MTPALRLLAAFLGDELGELAHRSEAATVEARACKEILLAISVLIRKLQVGRCEEESHVVFASS